MRVALRTDTGTNYIALSGDLSADLEVFPQAPAPSVSASGLFPHFKVSRYHCLHLQKLVIISFDEHSLRTSRGNLLPNDDGIFIPCFLHDCVRLPAYTCDGNGAGQVVLRSENPPSLRPCIQSLFGKAANIHHLVLPENRYSFLESCFAENVLVPVQSCGNPPFPPEAPHWAFPLTFKFYR